MSTPHIILWAIVFAVGVPSAWRNPTAAALVLSWVFVEGIYVVTGDGLAVDYYIFPDIFTLAVIFAKTEWCNLRPYQSTWHQIKCILLERSPADRLIMLIFPLMWAAYVMDIHPYYRWWILWALVIVQFLAAGAESLSNYTHCRRVKVSHMPPDQPGTLLVAYHAGGRFG